MPRSTPTPEREVARFSESHLFCAAENGIDAHLSQARTVYRGVTIRSNVDLELRKTLVHSPLGRPYVEQNNKTHRLADTGTAIAAGVAKNRSIFFESRSRDVHRAGWLMRQEVPTSSADGPPQPLSGFGRCCPWGMALYDDTCGLIPSSPLTAFPRRLY